MAITGDVDQKEGGEDEKENVPDKQEGNNTDLLTVSELKKQNTQGTKHQSKLISEEEKKRISHQILTKK